MVLVILGYYKNMADVLEGKSMANADPRSGHNPLELIVGIYKSSQTRKKITLPLTLYKNKKILSKKANIIPYYDSVREFICVSS